MRTNKELKIALIVGAVMVIFCVVMVLLNTSSNESIDLQVYKNTEVNGQRGYVQCEVPATILEEINVEFKKARNLNSSHLAQSRQIQGTYKIISGDHSVAFDDDKKNEIYNIDEKKLYSFESTIYTLVTSVCE